MYGIYRFFNSVGVTTTSTGSGSLVLGSAVDNNHQDFTGFPDNGITVIRIESADGTEWEVCESVITGSGTNATRGQLYTSSTGSHLVLAAGTHTVRLVNPAEFLDRITGNIQDQLDTKAAFVDEIWNHVGDIPPGDYKAGDFATTNNNEIWFAKVDSPTTSGDFIQLASSTSVATYLHTQVAASTTWTINHGLGITAVPVTVTDSSGNDIVCNVARPTDNQVVVTTVAASTGYARIN